MRRVEGSIPLPRFLARNRDVVIASALRFSRFARSQQVDAGRLEFQKVRGASREDRAEAR